MEIAAMLTEKKTTLRELQEDIRALERVQHMSSNGIAKEGNVDLMELQKRRTQKEALDYIADCNSGRVVVNDAKAILIRAGFVKGQPKYAYGHLYNMLKNDERYEAMGVGTFRKKGFEAARNAKADLATSRQHEQHDKHEA